MAKYLMIAALFACVAMNAVAFAQDAKPVEAATVQPAQPAPEEDWKTTFDFKGSRFTFGYYDSQNDGTNPDGTFVVPDAKLRVNWYVAKDMTIISRMSLNNAKFNVIDILSFECKGIMDKISPSYKDSAFNPTLKVGRFKLDIGEETITDNVSDCALISNSAGRVTGSDEGFSLSQSYKKERTGMPMKWSFSVANGNKDVSADNEQAKAFVLKYGIVPADPLYISVTYFTAGKLGTAGADVSFADVSDPMTGATEWDRTIAEIDVRYDFMPGKEDRLNPGCIHSSDSRAILRLCYGMFSDSGNDNAAPLDDVQDRKGNFFFLEGLYNINAKFYAAAKYSTIGFSDGDYYSKLNDAANVNQYTRFAFGCGYRMNPAMTVKFEYSINSEDSPSGQEDPDNDFFGLLFTYKY